MPPTPKATPLPDQWRQWVAENLMRGAEAGTLRQALLGQGFGEAVIDAELSAAADHPWIRAGQRVGRAAIKREWMMTTQAQLAQLGEEAPIAQVPLPPLKTFIRDYYATNTPAVFRGAAAHWPAIERWSLAYFTRIAGQTPLEVQIGRAEDRLFDIRHVQHVTTMSMAELCQRIAEGGRSNDIYVTARNAATNAPRLTPLWEDLGQLGDGLLNRASPHFRPHLWLGPEGTETPLHHDLSNILFVQVRGKKRFTLIPPNQTPWLYNFHTVYSAVDPEAPDLERYPDYQRARPRQVELGPGDVIFIPVGWWHSVVSLSESISVGFVHLNAPNDWHVSYEEKIRGEEIL